MYNGRHTQPEASRGLAIVEFVIVLPICLMLMIGTAEFGRAFLQYNTLTKSVRQGARFVASQALSGSTGTISISGGLATQTQNFVVYGNINGTGSPLLPSLSSGDVSVTDAGGGNVTVSAVYSYNPIFAFIPRFSFGGSINTTGYSLQAAVTMRAL